MSSAASLQDAEQAQYIVQEEQSQNQYLKTRKKKKNNINAQFLL